VHVELDPGRYPTGAAVSDEQMACLPLDRHRGRGEWNYTLRPEPSGTAAATPQACGPAHPDGPAPA